MKPIRVLLITGYLGAGKTTFLNHLLGLPLLREPKLALIINEFGAVGVDGQLVRPGDYTRFDLNRGSIFCICIKTDFIRTLTDIAIRVQPEVLVVEATGVADPCDLEKFMKEPSLRGRFKVEAVICLVDAVNFTRVAPYMKTARTQLDHADGIVINKTDLVTRHDLDRLARVLTDLNPNAPQEQVTHGSVSEAFVQGLVHIRHGGSETPSAPSRLNAISLSYEGPINHTRFMKQVRGLGDQLLRLKGILDFGDGPVLVESVFDRITESPPPAGASLDNAFTVIVWGPNPDAVRRKFEDVF